LSFYPDNPTVGQIGDVSMQDVGGVGGNNVVSTTDAGGVSVTSSTQTIQAGTRSAPSSQHALTRGEILQKLKKEVVRFRTFQNWKSQAISPNILAKAGFFYFNDSDKVQCAFCLGVVGEWEPTDDAFVEHRKHFPRCHFILGLPVGNETIQGASPPPLNFRISGGYDVGVGSQSRSRGEIQLRNESSDFKGEFS
jgi:hypothetical protein